MNIIQCQQGDAVWIHERVGRLTASRMADVVTKLKNGKYTANRETYKMDLLTEILTGRATEHYVTAEMQHGIDTERVACAEYEMRYGMALERVGLVIHPTIDRGAASPDRLVGEDGLLEAKCPKTTTHLCYLIEGVLPEKYIAQCTWQLACTGRKWVDFISFDNRLHDDLSMFRVRMERDEKAISEMEAEAIKFLEETLLLAQKVTRNAIPVKPDLVLNDAPEDSGVPRAVLPEWVAITR